MFERFTKEARRVLVEAQEEARELGHNFIGTEHVVLGLAHSSAAGLVGVPLSTLRADVTRIIGSPAGLGEDAVGPDEVEYQVGRRRLRRRGIRGGINPPFTPRAKKVLELSLREALSRGDNFIAPAHMLLGVLREGEGVGAQILETHGVTHEKVTVRLKEQPPARESDDPFPPFTRPVVALREALSDMAARDEIFTSADALLLLLEDEESLARKVLAALGVTPDAIAAKAEELGPEGTSDDPATSFPVSLTFGGQEIPIENPELRRRILDLLKEHPAQGNG